MNYSKTRLFGLFLILSCLLAPTSYAQVWIQPEVNSQSELKTPYEKGVRYGWGFDLTLDNYGFGIGTQFFYKLNSQSEIMVHTQLSALRDITEQSFQTFYSQVVPNKYNRVLTYPIFAGYKQRILSNYIYDNFRIYLSTAIGPSLAYVYPYFNDVDGNGIRTPDIQLGPYEEYYDVLGGLSEGDQLLGTGGELMLSFDIGSSTSSFTSIRLGYVFHYYSEGIQIMEPNKYEINDRGQIIANPDGTPSIVPANDKQYYFGSPAFHITFGGLW